MCEGKDPAAGLVTVFGDLLLDERINPDLKAEALILPSEVDMAEFSTHRDPAAIHAVREQLLSLIAVTLRSDLEKFYQSLSTATDLSDVAMQQRKLKNVCLAYLSILHDADAIAMDYHQFSTATNMTDQYASLAALSHCDCPERIHAMTACVPQ